MVAVNGYIVNTRTYVSAGVCQVQTETLRCLCSSFMASYDLSE